MYFEICEAEYLIVQTWVPTVPDPKIPNYIYIGQFCTSQFNLMPCFVLVHVYLCSQCCLSLFLSTHQPGAWLDSLGTDVNKLCLRKSQTQNVCEHNCFQSHMSLLVFHSCHVFLQEMAEIFLSLVYVSLVIS